MQYSWRRAFDYINFWCIQCGKNCDRKEVIRKAESVSYTHLNSLFDRLIKLKIDEDILYKQFSVMKFQRVIEESILRKSKKCKIVFSKDNIYYNKDLICRIAVSYTHLDVYKRQEEVWPVDMFPWSGHVEVIIVMSHCGLKNKQRNKPQDIVFFCLSIDVREKPADRKVKFRGQINR